MDHKYGIIELATGPMFSGKSEWLVSRLRTHQVAQRKILAVRYAPDVRYSKTGIASLTGATFDAHTVSNLKDVEKLLSTHKSLNVFAIDEVQFYNPKLSDILLKLQKKGVHIYASGLDLDYRGVAWETTLQVAAVANVVHKLVAVCTLCHDINATRTQRLSKGKSRVAVGSTDTYTARCLAHFELPKD